MKLITTPFLSGLCYGPVHVGVYDPWTFVGQILLIISSPYSYLPACSSSLVPSPVGSVSLVVRRRALSVGVMMLYVLMLVTLGEDAS